MKKVAVFVDVQNVFYTVKESFGCHFNYTAFWDEVTKGREVVQAFAYAIDRRDPKQMGFQQILRDIGFEVKLKPFIQRRDGSAKGDWDVGITLDMIELAPDIDVAVLASGDGDFDLVVSKLVDKYNVDVEVYGARKLTAASLVQAATRFVPIEGRLLLSK
ncbi:MAG: NYN domain-containing protein [Fuerstiella sp.]|nr:NYN domain-containing protein [Fuerstiella sp.]MCP4856395.1 NYN domain-containing protein [Fuerstiella sp.]